MALLLSLTKAPAGYCTHFDGERHLISGVALSNLAGISMRSEKPVCLLVVEDESLLRMDTVYELEDEGFKVLDAPNADAAILILEQNADIRLIFTDINMPGSMDGLKLAHYVRKRWPPVRIIVTSGKRDLIQEEMPADSFFMTKPYEHAALKEKIWEMVA